MSFDLPPHIIELQESTRAVVRDLLKHEPEFNASGVIPGLVHETFREMGYYGIAVPEEYGGLDLGIFSSIAIQMELARLPAQFWGVLRVLLGAGAKAIVNHGSKAQKEEWLPRIAAGECVISFVLSEAGAGSDVGAMRTRAVKSGSEYIIDGTKMWISNAQRADLLMVFARTGEGSGTSGISAFLVTPDNPGFKITGITETTGASYGGVCEVAFDNCRVPADALVGEEGHGFQYAMESLNDGRLGVGATGVGLGELAVEETVAYASQREAFGQTLSDFQAVQHMLADMGIDMYAARQMLLDAAWQVEQGRGSAKHCSMVKVFCSEAAFRTADRAVQIHGGMGYSKGVVVERIFRDSRVLRIYEGASEIQRNLIAKAMLKDAR